MLIRRKTYFARINAARELADLHAYKRGLSDGRRTAVAEWDAACEAKLTLRTRERDEALKIIEQALQLLETLYANAMQVDMAAGTKSPITEDLERLREVIRHD